MAKTFRWIGGEELFTATPCLLHQVKIWGPNVTPRPSHFLKSFNLIPKAFPVILGARYFDNHRVKRIDTHSMFRFTSGPTPKSKTEIRLTAQQPPEVSTRFPHSLLRYYGYPSFRRGVKTRCLINLHRYFMVNRF